ncbi:hypothetical protein SNOG_14633 [Parastagonospora nodorum SN15]|uniref:Uncharacterized protein n=1 Tax=Phaeosphaeria nodorum (strain SN15 / ATCC MYA-4574 / FGSC 10173) TaxID=321614 RepID=Q0U0B4_PHANO|nr:hypothetical protein SNOG_14633 [Parastagonospora nodorum SN15]EAT77825.1 hypothetical protein SNOG_14633 [Parastagonospora nodorum SN15]
MSRAINEPPSINDIITITAMREALGYFSDITWVITCAETTGSQLDQASIRIDRYDDA